MTMTHSAPHYTVPETAMSDIEAALGTRLQRIDNAFGEIALHVDRDTIVETLGALREHCGYQQLMEIAGVDWPDRSPRFEIVYCLLSLTKNHRIRVHIVTDEGEPVQSVTGIWPVAGWLEREVFDLFGVLFSGNADLRRILTDYGFTGHPLRKDFPVTGYVELRYSQEHKRVMYEPVVLAQDMRTFDFLSPWEGAEYPLPGDEKVIKSGEPPRGTPPTVTDPKVTDSTAQTGAGKPGPN